MVNLNKVIRKINGTAYPYSFPANDEEKEREETVANVLVNALAGHQVEQRKDIFTVMDLGRRITESRPADESIEFTSDELAFLSKVLYQATYQVGPKGEAKGVYVPVVIAQVFEELKINE